MPRPPTLRRPKRMKGAEQVITSGVIWRITMTLDGSEGMSLDVMVDVVDVVDEMGEIEVLVFWE